MAKPSIPIEELVDRYYQLGSAAKVGYYYGLHRTGVQRRLTAAGIDLTKNIPVKGMDARTFYGPTKEVTDSEHVDRQEEEDTEDVPLIEGKDIARESIVFDLPSAGKTHKYILTCAQNNTNINKNYWSNLLLYAAKLEAKILVSRFSYNKTAYGKKAVKAGKGPTVEDKQELWYAEEISPYVFDERAQLAPDLLFCGELNISPSAVNPLSGLNEYAGAASTIFPHATIAMESVATLDKPAKLIYTTGTVTLLNYIQKKAGNKAEFHHSFGALIVEVNSDGNWWVRQLIADKQGTFSDITKYGSIKVHHQKLTTGKVTACVWGDIHTQQAEETIQQSVFGTGGVLDTLKPDYQFAHDILDFRPRNHHSRNDHHARYQYFIERKESVYEEVKEVVDCLQLMNRDFCQTVVVDSNHDNALQRWLKEADYRTDPINAEFFLQLQSRKYKSIRLQDTNYHVFEDAIRIADKQGVAQDVKFLRENESFQLKDVEFGMHGHLGASGSRGSARGLAKIGTKSIIGHSHSARIVRGCWQCGTFSKLNLDYVKGPSAWTHTFCIMFDTGKRQLITFRNGKWHCSS